MNLVMMSGFEEAANEEEVWLLGRKEADLGEVGDGACICMLDPSLETSMAILTRVICVCSGEN